MNWVKTINDAIEYMEGCLTEEITLADIAKHVNLSAFHFQRAFSLLTDMTPAGCGSGGRRGESHRRGHEVLL